MIEAVVDAVVDLNLREAWACEEGEEGHGAFRLVVCLHSAGAPREDAAAPA